MIDIKKPDQDFDIMTIPDMELFLALKPAIVSTIKTINHFEDIQDQDVKLSNSEPNRRQAFGADRNLYPHIILDIAVKSYLSYEHFDLFLDTFSIKLAQHKYNPQMIENDNLTSSYINLLTSKFPNSDYLNKRSEYFKKAEIRKRIDEELLFF